MMIRHQRALAYTAGAFGMMAIIKFIEGDLIGILPLIIAIITGWWGARR